jgi:hypothetical protein
MFWFCTPKIVRSTQAHPNDVCASASMPPEHPMHMVVCAPLRVKRPRQCTPGTQRSVGASGPCVHYRAQAPFMHPPWLPAPVMHPPWVPAPFMRPPWVPAPFVHGHLVRVPAPIMHPPWVGATAPHAPTLVASALHASAVGDLPTQRFILSARSQHYCIEQLRLTVSSCVLH